MTAKTYIIVMSMACLAAAVACFGNAFRLRNKTMAPPARRRVRDVLVLEKTPAEPPPVQAFYVILRYAYPGTAAVTEKTVGPFPASRKDLLFEFLELLQAMLDAYPGHKPWNAGYTDVPGYKDWFDRWFPDTETDEEARFRSSMRLFTKYVPEDREAIARLAGYGCVWYDGSSGTPNPVEIVYDEPGTEQ